MKKISIILLTMISSFTVLTNANMTPQETNKNHIEEAKYNHIKSSNNKSQETCIKEAYYMITEMEKILNKTDDNSNEALFNKIKTSNLWKSLNRENKEKLAENVIKWTMEGDGKIKKVKKNMANYYMEYCNKL